MLFPLLYKIYSFFIIPYRFRLDNLFQTFCGKNLQFFQIPPRFRPLKKAGISVNETKIPAFAIEISCGGFYSVCARCATALLKSTTSWSYSVCMSADVIKKSAVALLFAIGIS